MKRTLLVICTFLAVFLTACGNGAPSTKIEVVLTDFQFTPNNFTVPAGQLITITLSNNGAVEHDFVIMKSGAAVGDSFGPEDEANVFWDARLKPGESRVETFTSPLEPGEYQVVCGIAGHFQAGMVGTLTVK